MGSLPISRREPNFQCPSCGPVTCGVRDSRPVMHDGKITIRRIRECPKCNGRFHTFEALRDDSDPRAELTRTFEKILNGMGL